MPRVSKRKRSINELDNLINVEILVVALSGNPKAQIFHLPATDYNGGISIPTAQNRHQRPHQSVLFSQGIVIYYLEPSYTEKKKFSAKFSLQKQGR